ncbi:MAG: 1-deoxy-D-xylulose-5-phosphate reductoisomerase [Acidobacteria bacterium]|nr:1-deoxy-D-xylulose-5-phosphate reductoisomerase [Acidobacteriota bacterium]
MKAITILGSTGSIGTSALDVIRSQRNIFRVAGLAAGRNMRALAEQIREFEPECVSVLDDVVATQLRSLLAAADYPPDRTEILSGEAGTCAVAALPAAEVVISSMVGFSGLKPTYHAIQAGKDIALANKEVLVAGGEFITRAARQCNVRLVPVDSEHNAIFQCLRGESTSEIKTIWLTASGGPFRTTPLDQLVTVSPEEALRHPTWRMGPKITIDSATMMNKGLEIIEAHWLFGLPADAIQVVVHPQSTIHSMVEFQDGSFIAQLGVTDMRLPIHYALHYPARAPFNGRRMDPFTLGALEFHAPDFEKFPCLTLAYQALRQGGSLPTILNAANEVAVAAFLRADIRFTDIPRIIGDTLAALAGQEARTLEDILHLNERSRQSAYRIVRDLK